MSEPTTASQRVVYWCGSCEEWDEETCTGKDHRCIPKRSDVAILNELLTVLSVLRDIRDQR